MHIAAFYHFTDFADYRDWRPLLTQAMKGADVKGTILLASEGINGTIAGTREGVEEVLACLRKDSRFEALFVKESHADHMPFHRAKVRLKKEIITLGLPADVSVRTGKILSPQAWNELLDDPELVLLDTRNTYETKIGTFENAIVWPLDDFQELPEKILASIAKKQKVAMFCTGGIRCEKLSSWMLGEGYEEIYQLEGGILHYLNTVPQEQSKWQGECYVFDGRVAVGHSCEQSTGATMCPACGSTLSPEDREHPAWLPGIQCGACV